MFFRRSSLQGINQTGADSQSCCASQRRAARTRSIEGGFVRSTGLGSHAARLPKCLAINLASARLIRANRMVRELGSIARAILLSDLKPGSRKAE